MHKVRTIKYPCGEMKWMALLCALYRTEQMCACALHVYYYCCCFLECWSTIFLSSWSNKLRNVWHKTSKETFQLMLNALAHTHKLTHSHHSHGKEKRTMCGDAEGKCELECKNKRKKEPHTQWAKERKNKNSTKRKRRRKIRNAKGFSIIWFNNNVYRTI